MSTILKPTNPLLPDIFELHGKWRAEKPALITPDETLSWAQFNARCNQVGNGLLGLNLEKGDRVVLLMSNGQAMAISLFGIMNAGLVSAPLNVSVNDAAIKNMILDCGASAIIATADHAERIDALLPEFPKALAARLICAEGPREGWISFEDWRSAQNANRPAVDIAPDDFVNIIYSSGTTGQPKGIVHTHQGRRDWAYDLAITLRYNSASRFLATIGLYSNITWVGMLCALLPGGCLIVRSKFDAVEIWEQIARDKITHLSQVPVQYERMIDVPAHETYDATSIKGMMSAGSPLRASVKSALFERFDCGIIELYGLTEGVITTLDPEDAKGRMASVGRPLIGTDLVILSDDDKICPIGEPGEIVSCGRIIMPGYYNRPDATEDAQWRDENGIDWLRTGDIGYLDAEGFLYIVDRKKDMILSGGQNIYPQDIEAVFAEHPDVQDVAVIGIPSKKWGETPLAIIALKNGAADVASIQTWANAQLGKQQRVSGVKIADEIPRNPNGKILKRNLRETYKTVSYD